MVLVPIYLQDPRHMSSLKAGWLGLGGWQLGGSQSRTMVDDYCLIMISGGRQLQGHNQVELAIVGVNWCLGLRCESCDVGCLELFGFEEDERVVIGGAIVDGSCWITWCLPLRVWVLFLIFFFFFFWFRSFKVWCLGDIGLLPLFCKNNSNMFLFWNYLGLCPCF